MSSKNDELRHEREGADADRQDERDERFASQDEQPSESQDERRHEGDHHHHG